MRGFEPELDDAGVPIGCPKCGGLKGGTPMCCKKDEPLPSGKMLIEPKVGEPVEEALVEEEAPAEEAEEEVEEEVEEEAEEALDEEPLEAYLEELPVKELKKLCKEANLSVKGKKAALVARLLE